MKWRDGRLKTHKRKPQLIGGEASLHQCWREYGTRWLRIEDRKALLMKAMFLDLIKLRLEVWDRLYRIGSLAKTKMQLNNREYSILHKLMLSRLLQIAQPVLTLASSSCFSYWMASGILARMDLWQSMALRFWKRLGVDYLWEPRAEELNDLSAKVYKNFVMDNLEDLNYLRLRALENFEADKLRMARYYD